MSNMMNSLYAQRTPFSNPKPSSEPIDISSGDEDDDASPKSTSNGASAGGENSSSNTLKRLLDSPPHSGVKKSKMAANQGMSQSPRKENIGSTPTSVPAATNTKKNKVPGNNNRFDIRDCARNKRHEIPQAYNMREYNDRMPMRSVRKYKKELEVLQMSESFRDIGGMDSTLKELCEMLIHIKSPEFYFQLGLLPSRGLLLHGPPGCGKTFLARAVAGQLKLPLLEVPATELIAGISGESEERIRDVFDQAVDNSPCVLFIDEIDAIGGNRQWASKDMERRIVSQLISSLDNLKTTEFGQSVLVIAATTRPDNLDPGLRRIGRFDHEIAIHIPTRKERREILRIQCEGLTIDSKFNYDKVAELTPGYVGADLLALVSRAAAIAVKRRSMKKFRELHAANEQNMTTVTLDDDENESVAGKEATEATDKPSSADKTEEKTIEKVEVEAAGDKSDADQPAKEKTGKETIMEVDPQVEEKSTAQQSRQKQLPEDEFYEPTLVELTNFLDNPPEEFSDPNFCLTLEDFIDAIKVLQPSAKREGFITVPDITWDDIGSLQDIRDELKLAVLAPVKFPEKLAQLGLTAPSGVLLCGPPGCGKTLLAKAIANEAGINFISVKGPELMNMYVGESERAVRACFQRARNSAPCVIFFDEFDSLCPKRSDNGSGSSGTRIVNQLLTEMDGVEDRKGVYILAATNRPDIIDPAILRPGRLDTILYVGLPKKEERVEILKATTKNGKRPLLADDVDLNIIAARTEGYTGADLAGLVKQASMFALRQSLSEPDAQLDSLCVRNHHFEEALKQLRPSVNEQDRKEYERLRVKFAAPRAPSFEAK
ncbi:uncharacterized AAA domain-containing protein C16E9.10c isoform X2 [Scaptodrosophila lebanonensis]|nr:uncharacterized AAA domain-containing protein C16E9.10c isoform X2 [Scaptodrosophila lebanonensis]